MKVAVVQKCPSNINFERSFQIKDLTVFNMSSVKVSRLLKRDVDLEGFNPSDWDWVILIGSEAVKEYSKVTSVSDYTGKVLPGKNGEENLIASISPGVLAFKPEVKPVFEATVASIQKIINGEGQQDTSCDVEGITDPNRAIEYVKMVRNMLSGPVALDSETSALAPRDGFVLGLSISHATKQGVYISSECLDGPIIDELQAIIDERPVVFHNAKFDMKFFMYHFNLDFDTAHCVHDTMILHYLLDERQGTHGLKSLTMKYGSLGDYDRDLDEFKKDYCKKHGLKQKEFTYDLIPYEIMVPYAAKDTAATLELFNKFLPILERNDKLKSCYYNMMLPALHFLTRMEERGIPVSVERLTEARKELTAITEELKEELYSFEEVRNLEESQGAKFNPNSTVQVRKLLFDYLKLPVPGKLTATGNISTDAEVMQELSELHRVPDLILGIKKNSKLISTYIDKLVSNIDQDGFIRTGFNLTSTTSGRLSSSGTFNMQQLPRDNPIIKGCVKAKPGYKIVAVD